MNKSNLSLCICTLFVLFTPPLSYADEISDLKAQMNAMEERHQKEMAQLKAKIDALESGKLKTIETAPAPIQAETVQAKESIFSPRWKDGLGFTSEDKNFDIKVGGRVHLDSAWATGESDLENKVGHLKSGAEVRRAHIALKGSLYQDFLYQLEYDFSTGDALIRDTFIGLKNVPLLGTIRLGHFFEPFSLDTLVGTNFVTFMESSLPANAFAPFRNDGVAIRSNAFNQRMEWEAGVFMDTDSYGKTTSSKPNFTGRLTFLPYYEEEGKKLLHLGGSYSLRNPKGTLRYSTYPEAHLMPNFVDTGKFNSERANLFGVESAFIFGPLFLQGEYIANAIESINDSPDLYFNGFYAQASYFLTGEYKPYDKITGTFGRVQPKNNFSLRGKSWGAWEIAGRYSYVDLNDESVNGGTLSDITLGLNWYWNPNMRVMLNYIHSYLKDTGDADIVQTRFQADF